MNCLILGQTNREIAETLMISRSTAKAHVEHILRKLDVHNRVAAVALAVEERANAVPKTVVMIQRSFA